MRNVEIGTDSPIMRVRRRDRDSFLLRRIVVNAIEDNGTNITIGEVQECADFGTFKVVV